MRVWSNGASVVRGDEKAPVPVDLAPDELTVEKAEELIEKGSGGPRVLGDDPETGLPVLALTGRFGPFVQLGEMEDGSKEKPKRASLLSTMDPDDGHARRRPSRCSRSRASSATIRRRGRDHGSERPVRARTSRRATTAGASRPRSQIFTVTLAEAEALFAQPKRRGGRTKPPIAELGPHPDSGAPVRVLDGRFGPYVTDGTINATVPRGVEPAEVDARAGRRAAARARRTWPGEEGAAKKTAKKSTKKPAKKDRQVGRLRPADRRHVGEGDIEEAAASQTARAGPARRHVDSGPGVNDGGDVPSREHGPGRCRPSSLSPS